MREWGIRELMAEQRARVRSGNVAERFAAALYGIALPHSDQFH